MSAGTILVATAAVASLCAAPRSADDRAYCRALSQQNVGICYSIANPDLRTMCRAEVSRNAAFCDGVLDPAFRAACKSRAGGF